MSTAGAQSRGALVRGMSDDDLKAQSLIASNLSPGALDNFKDDDVIIGYRLAQTLGIKPGDSITLISPQGTATAFGTVPRIKSYTVAGTFNVGMYEFDNAFIFMPLDTAQTYFNIANAVTSIEVMVADPDQVRPYDREISQALGGKVKIFDWQQSNLSFFNAVEVERNVMFLILTLIILVAAFNIISSMIMMVKDKGRDIAILRTMGATRGIDAAHLHPCRRQRRLCRHVPRLRHRRRIRHPYRGDPPVHPSDHRHRSLLGRDLFPDADPGARRSLRGRCGGGDGLRPVLPRHDLSRLARGAARSGRGAAI